MNESIRDLPQRIAAKIAIHESGCWRWRGYLTEGYGKTWWIDREKRAHRVIYEILVGPIPEGLDLDHLCHNEDLTCSGGETCVHRCCVNPEHLKPRTRRDNTLASPCHFDIGAHQRNKSHCPQGHPYAEGYIYAYGRACRICVLKRMKEQYARKKGLRQGAQP